MSPTEVNGRLDPDRRRVLILANPKAGAGRSARRVEGLVGALRARGLWPTVCWRLEELTDLAEGAAGDVRCVVAAGGDGTLREAINRAPGLPAAVLPLGNENLVARHCGVGRSPRELAEVIAGGHVRRLDLARANGQLFCLMVSAGFDAEVVHRVHRRRRGHISRFTYVVPAVQALGAYNFPPVEVEVEETGERLRGALALAFNLPEYGPGLPIAPAARPDDGLLDVCVFERPGALQLLRYATAVLGRRHPQLPDVRLVRAKRVRLWAERPVPVQADGDPAGFLPVTVEAAPGALRLLVAKPLAA